MMKMEEMIREKGKEDFYNYYLGLGYDQKTAAVLTLFTYGKSICLSTSGKKESACHAGALLAAVL